MSDRPIRILIAGIGGASLGTEILKCLRDAGGYEVFGCDISEYAYGHHCEAGFTETFLVERKTYIESLCDLCMNHGIQVVISGGEEPLGLLSQAKDSFQRVGVSIAANSPEVIALCTNKRRLFTWSKERGFSTPWTVAVEKVDQLNDLKDIPLPCVVKPSVHTGGSHLVFLAANRQEVISFANYLLSRKIPALIQEYLPLDEGEFTVGVLTLPNGQLLGSIAMRRLLTTKLSVLIKTEAGVISSGYSQGLIDEFPEVQTQAERIAEALGSVGPLNIQGRLCNKTFIPFEINPRFSASTYLRALAGFNEVDIYLRYLVHGMVSAPRSIRPGFYLRSLSEAHVSKEAMKTRGIYDQIK